MRYFAEGEMCKAKCARRISSDKALFTSYVSLCETASSAPVRALGHLPLKGKVLVAFFAKICYNIPRRDKNTGRLVVCPRAALPSVAFPPGSSLL